MMIDRQFLTKLLCIALVTTIMLPVGRALFPYVSADLTPMQFQTIEAVLSASLGFGIYGILG
ncbi:MAG TPA: hypothetical protein VFA57_06835 [Pseudolabrys sp.]|jgi:hypothetical protein|nr:hypothetical protein [Pseudolabrys sp.]